MQQSPNSGKIAKKRLWLVCALGIVIAFWVGWKTILQHRPSGLSITQANYYRIRQGMRQEEVEAILGGPPGTYTVGSYDYQWIITTEPSDWPSGRLEGWYGTEGAVVICFDENGIVLESEFLRVSNATPLRQILQWLGL